MPKARTLFRHFIAFARRLTAPALHDLVKRRVIRSRLAVLEKGRRPQSRHLFDDRHRHELGDARSLLLTQPLNRFNHRGSRRG